jgi:uncharacterized membrane protein
MKETRAVRTAWLATLLGALPFYAGVFLAPVLRAQGRPLSALLYAAFSPTCHQLPGRSFYLHGFPLAVCGRCLGIYSGFILGVLAYPFLRGFRRAAQPKANTFAIFTLPIAVDTAGNFFHLWSTTNALRLAIGILWGVILPFYFIPGISELCSIRPGKEPRKGDPGV